MGEKKRGEKKSKIQISTSAVSPPKLQLRECCIPLCAGIKPVAKQRELDGTRQDSTRPPARGGEEARGGEQHTLSAWHPLPRLPSILLLSLASALTLEEERWICVPEHSALMPGQQ